MPRLSTRLIQTAWKISPLVALLLRACRDIPSARNELRWISEHVVSRRSPVHSGSFGYHDGHEKTTRRRLYRLCKSRARGVPLQYILGTQPFGDLEIQCRPGVLIPRSETEAYTLELSRILLDEIRNKTTSTAQSNNNHEKSSQTHHPQHHHHHQQQRQNEKQIEQNRAKPRPFKILDICSGTGCISLQLYAQLRHVCPHLEVVGLDISQKAIDLSRLNIQHNKLLLQTQHQHQNPQKQNQSISYHRADIFSPSEYIKNKILGLPVSDPHEPTSRESTPFSDDEVQEEISTRKNNHVQQQQQQQSAEMTEQEQPGRWDLIISNPPYISAQSFMHDTTRSVRNFEPKLALVPPDKNAPVRDSSATSESSSSSPTTTSTKHLLSSSCRPEDVFYARILDLSISRHLRPSRILFEVADLEQACRVAEMMLTLPLVESESQADGGIIEIWRDDPSPSGSNYYLEEQEKKRWTKGGAPEAEEEPATNKEGEEEKEREEEEKSVKVVLKGREIPIRGAGNIRSVYFFAGIRTGDQVNGN